MVKNKPRHGENIIDVVAAAGGGQKRVANFQFQRYLDEMTDLINTLNEQNAILEQRIYDLENP